MIEVTKLNGEQIVVNADHIESVEAHPDTTIALHSGRKIVVREDVQEIVRRAVEYQRRARGGTGAARPPAQGSGELPHG